MDITNFYVRLLIAFIAVVVGIFLGGGITVLGYRRAVRKVKAELDELEKKVQKEAKLVDAIEEITTLDETIEVAATAFILSISSFDELPDQSRKLFAELVLAISKREHAIHEVNLNLDDETIEGADAMLKSYGKSWVAEFTPQGTIHKLYSFLGRALEFGYIQDDDLKDE